MRIIVCSGSGFDIPDRGDRLIRKKYSLISFHTITPIEAPLHTQKSESSTLKIRIRNKNFSPFFCGVKTLGADTGSRDIALENICNNKIHTLCTTTHEECIMKEKGRMRILRMHILSI